MTMFNPSDEKMWDEIQAGARRRDAHLDKSDELVKRFMGRYFNSNRQADMPITENFAFELVSVLRPAIIYDNPRCIIQSMSPNTMDDATRKTVDQLKAEYGAVTDHQLALTMGFQSVRQMVAYLGGMTAKDFALAVQLACNRWSNDNQINHPLTDLAIDFFFGWGVSMVTTVDQPGYYGVEMVPQMPYLVRLPQQHYVFDAASMSHETTDANGPRWKGHMWRADKEDLLIDPEFDSEAIEQMMSDSDRDKYYFEKDKSIVLTDRNEIFAWDIWLPEAQIDGFSRKDGYCGSWRTIAVCSGKDGTTKKAREIRAPRPAYVPEWGPYTMFGYHKVINDPFPLSIMVATAEQVEALNMQTNAASEDARTYKRIGLGQSENAQDANRIKMTPNGEMVLLDSVDTVKQMELGGVSDMMMKHINIERDRLERLSGMSAASRGNPKGDISATAEAIASEGNRNRLAGIQSSYRKAVQSIFRTAAWFMVNGEDQVFSLGEEGAKFGIDEFIGGLDGRSKFRFHDLSLAIDNYSMEHTDQALVQKRMVEMFTLLRDTAPIMVQTPYIKWKEPMERLFEIANIHGASDWIDDQLLGQAQGQQQMGNDEVKSADLRLTKQPEDEGQFQQMSAMQSMASERAAAL
jgi:hypothetical protein